MTNVIMYIDPKNGIMYDCLNHADDYDVCTIMSTLTNVLVEAAGRAGKEPTVYLPGHVRIDLPPGTTAEETFRTVQAVIQQAAEQNPEHIRIY